MGTRLPRHTRDIEYAEAISCALRVEVGDSHRAIKTVMGWTGASERSARNWLQGRAGPSGPHLIDLMRHSEAIARTVLLLSGKEYLVPALALLALRDELLEAVRTIDSYTPRDVHIHVTCALLIKRA